MTSEEHRSAADLARAFGVVIEGTSCRGCRRPFASVNGSLVFDYRGSSEGEEPRSYFLCPTCWPSPGPMCEWGENPDGTFTCGACGRTEPRRLGGPCPVLRKAEL